MKKKITLLVFVLFSTVLIFGQNVSEQNADPASRSDIPIQDGRVDQSIQPLPSHGDITTPSHPIILGGEESYIICSADDTFNWFDVADPGDINYIADYPFGQFPQGACFDGDGVLWFTDTDGNIYTIDETNGDFTSVGSAGVGLNTLAYDDITDMLYGATADHLYTIDMSTGDATSVGALTGIQSLWISMDFDNEGNLYGYDLGGIGSSGLYSVDTGTGACTLIGHTGLNLNFGQDMSYDKDNDIMYAAVFNSDVFGAELHTVDLETGQFSLIGPFPEQQYTSFAITYFSERFTVTFEIEDEDGNAIEEAIVTLNDTENDPGDYEFLVPEGDYDYTVEKEHYVTVEGEITVDDDKTVEVIMDFELYTLTLEADPEEGGTVDGDGDYRYEEEVEVSAELEEGYGFINWTDEDGEEVSDELTFDFIMPGEDVTLTANFYKIPLLTLEANPEEGGTVTGAGYYEEGTTVEIIAKASENEKIYQFVNWTGDTDHVNDPEEAETTVTMPGEDVSLTANFQDVTATIEAEEVMLSVFPNPAKNNFTVKSNELINEIKLISVSGQVVKIIVVDALETKFNVSNLKEGIYLLQIHTNEGVVTERVQISR